jgi:hypothetical protein
MRRSRSLLLLLLVGCGGRDPLLGVNDEGILTPPVAGGTGGGTATGGTHGNPPVMTPPASQPDAGTVKPPVMVPPDAATPAKPDAGPATSACAFPKCVAALVDSCKPAGTCVQQLVMGGGGISTNVCFQNGVKVITSIRQGGGRTPPVNIRVMRPDGSGCYSIDSESRGSGVTGLNYRTPSGELVATATRDGNRLAVTCIGTTTPQVVDATCQPGLVASNSCTNGSCQ